MWKTIVAYPNYEMDEYGNVRRLNPGKSTRVGRLLTWHPNESGYARVDLTSGTPARGRKVFVHKLVLETFGPPKPEWATETNHVDGDKWNNHISNLEWSTREKNMDHAWSAGLRSRFSEKMRGESNPDARLTDAQVLEIRRIAKSANFESFTSLGRLFGVSRITVSNIVNGRTWKHLLKNRLEGP